MILAIIGVTVLVALLIGFIVVLFQHNRDLREELDILKEDRQPLLNQISNLRKSRNKYFHKAFNAENELYEQELENYRLSKQNSNYTQGI